MIQVDVKDRKPICEQLVENIKTLVVCGAMHPDEQLPSVRALAGELAINPNTIQKAYNELENEGYIYSVPGKGSFASGEIKVDVRRKEEWMRRIREMVAELRFLGVEEAELASLLKEKGESDHD